MKKRKKCSKIDMLPPELKDTVERMMQEPTIYYKDIVKYVTDRGHMVSLSGVQRHAANLSESINSLKMAQENFRVIMEEINRYPNLDTTEGIIRLLSHYVMESINKMPEEDWKSIDPVDLMRQATALTRAAAYKSKVDISNKDMFDKGLDYVKTLVFDAMAKENPELYKQVSSYLETKARGD